MKALLHPTINIATNAGKIIMEYYTSSKDLNIEQKEDNSPVTQADIAADNYILKQLKTLTPEIPILSEEGIFPTYDIRKTWNRYWLIDPLDGTKGFIKRNDQFTVNIALIIDQQPVLGVVYHPVNQECFYAVKDFGAFQVDNKLQEKKIFCATHQSNETLKIILSGQNPSEKMISILNQLGEHDISSSSSSIKFCKVADGSFHMYPRIKPTCEWDTAASHIILREAGGEIIQVLDQKPITYNTKDDITNESFVAYSKDIHKTVNQLIEHFNS
jgi:3'(2'), 5'-bisphosphate nucleotidase